MTDKHAGPFDPTVLDQPRRDNGGPASLMTLRDYFAAHAPEQRATWFEPTMAPRPTPEWPDDQQRFEQDPLNWEALRDYDAEKNRQYELQWPYAYATAMIAERKKAEGR
jgi:hypothetical protein